MGTMRGFEAMIDGLKAEKAAREIRARRQWKRDGFASCEVSFGTVSLTRSARRPGAFQITTFGKDGTPWGHTERDDLESALREFADQCYTGKHRTKKRGKAEDRRPKGARSPKSLVKLRLVLGRVV